MSIHDAATARDAWVRGEREEVARWCRFPGDGRSVFSKKGAARETSRRVAMVAEELYDHHIAENDAGPLEDFLRFIAGGAE
jgi:hypothetical protein